jgi:large subunit ribosomal protein L32
MAVPKKRVSKQRKRKRRGSDYHKAEMPTLQACPRCGDPKVPHRVCPSCGYYRGEAVLEIDVA